MIVLHRALIEIFIKEVVAEAIATIAEAAPTLQEEVIAVADIHLPEAVADQGLLGTLLLQEEAVVVIRHPEVAADPEAVEAIPVADQDPAVLQGQEVQEVDLLLVEAEDANNT